MSSHVASRTPPGIRFEGVEATSTGIFELDEGVRALFIARGTIGRCAIRSGFVAERTVFGAVVGVGLAILGAILVVGMFGQFDRTPDRGTAAFAVGGGVMAGLGAMMLRHSIRRGLYLELETTSGVRKLAIGKAIDPTEVATFVTRAREELGYDIELRVEG